MENNNDIRKAILRKLSKHGYWGGRHTAYENLSKGFPKHLGKDIREVIDEMIKENILLPKPTSYGLHVSLNPRIKDIIEQILGIIQ